MTVDFEPSPELRDVIIIGGGPAGLAVASRLGERMPAATFTDDEHQRYHWIRKHTAKMAIKNHRTGAVRPPACRHQRPAGVPDVLVLDGSGDQWMARWKRLFGTFGISHLRSPMFFHIDPAERDGLLSYAHMSGRGHELNEICGCVGKELSKHRRKMREKKHGRQPQQEPTVDERDRNDYFVPSLPLFTSHCDCLVDRYDLRRGVVQNEQVVDIRYGYVDHVCATERVFSIHTNKTVHYSRTAVLAVGPGNEPSIPGGGGGGDGDVEQQHADAATHAMKIKTFPCDRVQSKIAARSATNILIVGGGLTSAQLADLAIRRGVTKVWLIMRGELKVKPFDVPLEWVGKFRNFEQAAFWTADSDEERWAKIVQARNGGSITQPYRKVLERHVASGRLRLMRHTTLAGKQWDAARQGWRVRLEGPDQEHLDDDDDGLPVMDHVYYATGVQTDVTTLPYLQSLMGEYPVATCGGMPRITEDMQWRADVPLFVTGRLAALQLGPGAPNLIGARVGAERVCWALQDRLDWMVDATSRDAGGGRRCCQGSFGRTIQVPDGAWEPVRGPRRRRRMRQRPRMDPAIYLKYLLSNHHPTRNATSGRDSLLIHPTAHCPLPTTPAIHHGQNATQR